MPNTNQDYLTLAIKRQALLERLKSGQVKDFAKYIKKVEKLIRETLGALEDPIGDLSRTKLNKLISQLRLDQATIYQAGTTAFLTDTAAIAALYSSQEVLDLKKTVDLRGTKLNDFTKKEVWRKVIQRPMTTAGQLLEPWVKDFTTNEVARVNGAIRNGWAQGKTNQQLVQEIIGTKSKNYKDGILQTTRRNASTVVRTSVQHAASAARQDIWEANRDVVGKYEWVSTLDSVTSKQCRSLDGEQFEFGKGPIPPIHPNCRSTTIPVLTDEFDFLSKGRTRSAEDGPVDAKTSYYDWLKKQPASVQDQVLGKTRGKLFRDGGMSAERFRALQFDKNFEPLTLKEMEAIEPAAFKKAGLSTTTTTKVKPKSPENVTLGFGGKYDGRIKGIKTEALQAIEKAPNLIDVQIRSRGGSSYQPTSLVTLPNGEEITGIAKLRKSADNNVFLHEYGHHLDATVGATKGAVRSLGQDFLDARSKDAVYLTKEKFSSEKDMLEKLSEAWRGKKQFIGASDIVDSMTKGKAYNDYYMAGHGKKYYKRGERSRQTEIFANLFEAYSNQGERWENVVEHFPNQAAAFEKAIKEYIDE